MTNWRVNKLVFYYEVAMMVTPIRMRCTERESQCFTPSRTVRRTPMRRRYRPVGRQEPTDKMEFCICPIPRFTTPRRLPKLDNHLRRRKKIRKLYSKKSVPIFCRLFDHLEPKRWHFLPVRWSRNRRNPLDCCPTTTVSANRANRPDAVRSDWPIRNGFVPSVSTSGGKRRWPGNPF